METKVKKGQGFSSRIGLLLTLIGAAIGAGNFWRFPSCDTKRRRCFLNRLCSDFLLLCDPYHSGQNMQSADLQDMDCQALSKTLSVRNAPGWVCL